MKLLGSSKNETTKDEKGQNVPHFQITEIVLVHGNIVRNNYQHDSTFLQTFSNKKSFGHLLNIRYFI